MGTKKDDMTGKLFWKPKTNKCLLFAWWRRLLITYVKSIDSGQALQNDGPELDSNCLILMFFPDFFLQKFILEKSWQKALCFGGKSSVQWR